MTEAWRSVPKKYCELCKCWFYDNKVSIEHHERGARHKQNVQDKIRQISKKGREMEKTDKETMKALAQMEVEALRSYKNDLKLQPDIADNYNIHLNLAALPLKTKRVEPPEKQPKLNIKAGVSTIWREVLCPETKKSYFWNSSTNETKWEAPSEGYLSLAEQAIESSMTSEDPQNSKISNFYDDDSSRESEALDEEDAKEEERYNENEEGCSSSAHEMETAEISSDGETEKVRNKQEDDEKSAKIKPKKRPFGDWTPVEFDESITKEPKLENNIKEKESKKIKFEEKKFPTSNNTSKFKPLKAAGAGVATFKKPKQGSGRNLRNREDEDE